MSFSAALRRFQRRTMEKYEKVYRMSAFDLFAAVVMETPVDKGVLRNNWFASIGRPSDEKTESTDPSGQGTIAKINSVLNSLDLDRDVFLTNNLPYAVVIEFGGYPESPSGGEGRTSGGFSLKAPEGMVRINAANWDRIVRRNARRIGRAS